MAFKLGMTVDLYIHAYMLKVISITLTLMQGHSGLAGEKFSVEFPRQRLCHMTVNLKTFTWFDHIVLSFGRILYFDGCFIKRIVVNTIRANFVNDFKQTCQKIFILSCCCIKNHLNN